MGRKPRRGGSGLSADDTRLPARSPAAALLRWLGWLLAAGLALQLFFVVRIALMAAVDPQSTTFQRSELWWQASGAAPLGWRQRWVPYQRIAEPLKRAVLTAEDDGFVDHGGIEWRAIERAWKRNAALERRMQAVDLDADAGPRRLKIHGGSTITQQLAKNLLLSGERNYLRKGQELLLSLLLEAFLSKQRILEIYLNSVEWGNGVFGAEAAAQHYFRKSAANAKLPSSAIAKPPNGPRSTRCRKSKNARRRMR